MSDRLDPCRRQPVDFIKAEHQETVEAVRRFEINLQILTKIVKGLEANDSFVFTNKHLAAYAAELVERLTNRQPAGWIAGIEEGA